MVNIFLNCNAKVSKKNLLFENLDIFLQMFFRGLKSKTGDPELDSRLEMQEKIEREEREEERDEPGLLQKRRTFDDYKDDHRRGSGNTIGKG